MLAGNWCEAGGRSPDFKTAPETTWDTAPTSALKWKAYFICPPRSADCWRHACQRASSPENVCPRDSFIILASFLCVHRDLIQNREDARTYSSFGWWQWERGSWERDVGRCPSSQGFHGELGAQDCVPQQVEVPAEKPEVRFSQQHVAAVLSSFHKN